MVHLQALIDDAAARYAERYAAWQAEGSPGAAPFPEQIDVPPGIYTEPVTIPGGVYLVGQPGRMRETVISLDPTWKPPAPRPLWLIRLRSLRHYLPWL